MERHYIEYEFQKLAHFFCVGLGRFNTHLSAKNEDLKDQSR